MARQATDDNIAVEKMRFACELAKARIATHTRSI